MDGKFEMDAASGAVSCEALDREAVPSYLLQVQVTDNGDPPLSAQCQMEVSVLDANDAAPLFEEAEYAAEVGEDFPVGGTVLTVKATDADAPGPNSRLSYSLKDHSSALFLIHPQSGAVQTLGPLDAEARSLYSFTVVARDEGAPEPLTASARVTVAVADLNDHSPVFAATPFLANISTHTPSGQRILRVAATDKDGPGDNSRVTYRYTESPSHHGLSAS